MKTNAFFDKQFAKYDDANTKYRLGNKVLYNLVKKHPSNTNDDEIVAKFWIIGRTYAAAIERRANKKKTPGDFYYGYVAPTIRESELDKRIRNIKNKHYSEITEESIKDVLSLHKYLVELIKGLTEKEKRSLASKYLHFHLPKLVFIYDSRVSSVIGRFIKGNAKELTIEKEWDKAYSVFVYKAFEIYKTLKSKNFTSSSDTLPRVVDTFLLRYCDANNIKAAVEE